MGTKGEGDPSCSSTALPPMPPPIGATPAGCGARGGRPRVIAFDNRGHGQSEKLYEPERYGAPIMAEDARPLLDHLGIERADVIGYSMGARIAAFLVLKHPERVRSVIFGGLGINMVRGMVGTGPLAKALEAKSIDDVTNDTARSFRAFAEHTRGDLGALAACMRGPREKITPEQLAGIQCRRSSRSAPRT